MTTPEQILDAKTDDFFPDPGANEILEIQARGIDAVLDDGEIIAGLGSGEVDVLGKYLADIADIRVLTMAEEQNLGYAMRAGRSALEELKIAQDLERRRELYQIVEQSKSAREELIVHNLKLVVSIAKKYPHGDVQIMDSIQNGNLGLFKAAEKYDPDLGYKFSTYATWWIRQKIFRSFDRDESRITLSSHNSNGIKKYNRAIDRAMQIFATEKPSREQIAAVTDLTVDQIHDIQYRIHMQAVGDLDELAHDEFDSDTHTDELADGEDLPEEITDRRDSDQLIADFVNQALSGLSDRDREAAWLYFAQEGYTLDKIGRIITNADHPDRRITRERVRQLLKKTSDLIKQPEYRQQIFDLLGIPISPRK